MVVVVVVEVVRVMILPFQANPNRTLYPCRIICTQALQRRNDIIKENDVDRKDFEEEYLKLGDYIEVQNKLFGTWW